MKMYGGMEVQFHAFLTWAPTWRWVLLLTPPPHYHQGKRPGTRWIGGWVGRRAGLDMVSKRKIPSSRKEPNHGMCNKWIGSWIGPRNGLKAGEKGKKSLPCTCSEPNSRRSYRSLVTILGELPRVLVLCIATFIVYVIRPPKTFIYIWNTNEVRSEGSCEYIE
jgi:hypothetical protein